MKKIFQLLLFILITSHSIGQKNNNLLKGMYIQWGYNTEWYTKSNIQVTMGNGNKFILHNAKAHDKRDFDAILKKPAEISIPQYNYRIGFYLNNTHSKALEINFDHAKYVVSDNQVVRVTGIIDGQVVDADSILNDQRFLHIEHTDGANWLHINYVRQQTLLNTTKTKRPLINAIYKIGAGINIPRTDFTWRGDRLNNNFHVAGYNFSAEGGARLYMTKRLFLECTAKTGFVKYVNALANTTQIKNSSIKHHFGYFELISLIGYDIKF